MSHTFAPDDVGKLVETDDGEEVGVIAAVDGPIARVGPIPATGDDPATPSMANAGGETRPVEASAIREVTDDRVILAADRDLEGETTTAERPDPGGTSADELGADDPATRGAEVDPAAVTDPDPEAEFERESADRRTDAEVSVEDESRRTDAAVDPEDVRDDLEDDG